MGGRGQSSGGFGAAGRGGGGGGGEGEAQLAGGGGGGDERDELSAELFNGKIKIDEYNAAAKAQIRKIFGRNVSGEDLAKMVGAPDGSTVDIIFDKNEIDPRYAMKIEVYHKHLDSMTRTVRNEGGKIVITNETLFTDEGNPPPKGFGTRIFAQQVLNARRMGVDRITTTASRYEKAGQRSHNGYYTWVRLGYDNKLSSVFSDRQTQRLAASKFDPKYFGNKFYKAQTFNELMKLGGKDWWKEHGSTVNLTFDLSRGSNSIRVLNAYTRAAGIKLGKKTPGRS